jgi:protoporphyrinogen IX oxidase
VNDFTGWLGPAYLWVKAAHVTFVIFWLAGLFLLPRLYVYHQETTVGSPEDRAWIEREARVRSIILGPAMALVWILGLMLAFNVDAWHQAWFHAKLLLVIGLSAYQGWLGAYGKKLAKGERPLSGKAVRMLNEIPGIAAALIVVLVIVRPF